MVRASSIKNKLKFKKSNLFLYAIKLLIIVFIAFLFFVHTINTEKKAISGLYIQNINLHNLTKDNAISQLETITQNYQSQEHLFEIENSTYKYNAEETGVTIDIPSTIESIYSYGKNKSFINDKVTQTKTFVFKKEMAIITKIDEEKFNYFVETKLASFEHSPRNASLKYNPTTEKFEIEEEQNKISINKEALKETLLQNLRALKSDTIKLQKETTPPFITKANIQSLQQEADKIIDRGFTVKLKEKQFTVPKSTLASWMEVAESENGKSNKLYFNQNKIEQYINNKYFLGATEKPENSKFIIDENGNFKEIEQGSDGSLLDIQESAKSIIASLENNGTMALLYLKPVYADISKENIEDLEIATLLGYGESDFVSSPHNRTHNINTGIKKYHGIVLAPNEEFSFNDLLGEVDAKNGYLPSNIIKNQQLVQGYGGGICQISTTIFRAALNAGLKITERTNHSYVIDYYGKPGLDATIYLPSPDLKFINNTDSHILLQSRIKDTKLYFEIYGKDNGRSVIVDDPVAYDIKGDGSMKTYLTQTVRDKDNNIIEQQVFKSIYGPTKKSNEEDVNPLI